MSALAPTTQAYRTYSEGPVPAPLPQSKCSVHNVHRDIMFCNYLATANCHKRLRQRFPHMTGAFSAGAWARQEG